MTIANGRERDPGADIWNSNFTVDESMDKNKGQAF